MCIYVCVYILYIYIYFFYIYILSTLKYFFPVGSRFIFFLTGTGNLANWALYVLSFHYFQDVIKKRWKEKSCGSVF